MEYMSFAQLVIGPAGSGKVKYYKTVHLLQIYPRSLLYHEEKYKSH
jgi:ABC-type iron transport system FetAB ATPase subunit